MIFLDIYYFKYSYYRLLILFTTGHLSIHSKMVLTIATNINNDI